VVTISRFRKPHQVSTEQDYCSKTEVDREHKICS